MADLLAIVGARAPQPDVEGIAPPDTQRTGVEDFLRAAHGVARTPLPMPPQLDISGLMEKLRAARQAIPDIPELPTAPEWLLKYAQELSKRHTGQLRDLSDAMRAVRSPESEIQPPAVQAPSAAPTIPQPERGLWDWLHPEGTGSTKRGFNDIYPPLGR